MGKQSPYKIKTRSQYLDFGWRVIGLGNIVKLLRMVGLVSKKTGRLSRPVWCFFKNRIMNETEPRP